MDKRKDRGQEDTGLDRLPPHSLEAEQGTLGCILLSAHECLGQMVSKVTDTGVFYDLRHRLIYETLIGMYDRLEPIDMITLQQKLRDKKQLDSIGGLSYLASLPDSVPSASNLGHYVNIILQKHKLRKLIKHCTDSVNKAYACDGDASELVETFEANSLRLNDGLAKDTDWKLLSAVRETLGDIERDITSGGAITGLSTGYPDFDRMTRGLQAGEFIVIAARPSVGKSSLVMNIAEYLAVDQRIPVGIFSLEMTKKSLVRRLISARSRVNLRAINEEDFPRINEAAAKINRAPLYIDDTPGLTDAQVRARMRRMVFEHGIKLGIVDYLQLLRSAKRFTKRHEEVADISHGMKHLGRELGIPIIVCAQLNRELERDKKVRTPRISDLRECVSGDTRVLLADGTAVEVSSLVGKTPSVLALNSEHKISVAAASKVWCVGKRELFELRFSSGRLIKATGLHRFLGPTGWRRLHTLSAGDRLAIARCVPEPVFAKDDISDTHCIFLAHMIGDGSYVTHQPMRYTTASEECSAAVKSAAETAFGNTVKRVAGRGNWHQLIISGNGNRWEPKGANKWLRDLGIYGQRSKAKNIPHCIFALPNPKLALFLRHLWATDGTIGHAPNKVASFATSSRRLAEDILLLLLRFNIVGRVHRVESDNCYHVILVGNEKLSAFLDAIGAFGPRLKQATALRPHLRPTTNHNVDTVPLEVWGIVRKRMRQLKITQRAMTVLRGTAYGGSSHFKFCPSRRILMGYANLLRSKTLESWANSDLFWDRIISITPIGEAPVYDLTVPGPASWLANGIISHNSGDIEQDADLIGLLHLRNEKEDEEKEIGSVPCALKIGKQRNGPLGTVPLVFLKSITRFESASKVSEEDQPPSI